MHHHHKTMKYLCNAAENWVRKNLSHLGIDHFGCNFLDLKHNTYLPLGSGYNQYCDFMEKKLQHDFASRMVPGIRFWNPNEVLYQVVESLYQPDMNIEQPHPTIYALDWTVKTETGFEIFCAVSQRPWQPHHVNAIKQWMHVFSYEGAHIKQHKPKALLEIENREALREKFLNFDELTTPAPAPLQKAQFGELVLTGQEQAYIQHLVLQRPYREIATQYQVSEVAVRNVMHNIKCKLGCPTMSTPEMFEKLNACGAFDDMCAIH